MSADLTTIIFSGNANALKEALALDRALANEEVALPDQPARAHPLHRICDAVCSGSIREETGVVMAKTLLSFGSSVNPHRLPGQDSPLTAACSLRCDKLAMLYIGAGADIEHPGCHGGTALHWASWCGRDTIVKFLAGKVQNINRLCIDYKSTPLFWAIHGHRFGGPENQYQQAECARILLEHKADPKIPNFEGYLPIELLEDKDVELLELLRKH